MESGSPSCMFSVNVLYNKNSNSKKMSSHCSTLFREGRNVSLVMSEFVIVSVIVTATGIKAQRPKRLLATKYTALWPQIL